MAFLELLLFNVYEQDHLSLSDYARDIQLHQECLISKQSLHERFNEASVRFIKEVFSEQLRIKLTGEINNKVRSFFSGIYIQDTTKFILPEYMKDKYPGYGGAIGAEALASIHFKYELLKGEIAELKVLPGTYPDQQLSRDGLNNISKDHLYLSDLGFFSLDLIKSIQDEYAFYISRIKPKMNLYILEKGKYVQINLDRIRNELKRGRRKFYDFEGFIGSKRSDKIPVRFVITSVPKEIYQKRLKKVNKQNKSNGNQTSDAYKLYAQLNIFITNLSEKDFEPFEIIKLYRLRWQVELIFKTWKSQYKISHIKRINPCRITCQLYASLLLTVINWGFFSWLTWRSLVTMNKWLSIMKFTKQMKLIKNEQRRWLKNIKKNTYDFIKKISEININQIKLEKRKNRYNFVDILSIII